MENKKVHYPGEESFDDSIIESAKWKIA